MSNTVLFFCMDSTAWPGEVRLHDLRKKQAGLECFFWTPSLRQPFVPGRIDPRILAYSLMHVCRVFTSRGFAAVVMRNREGDIVHSSLIMPKFSRFPFMGPEDLQVGATFTREDHRGRGLALRAIDEAAKALSRPGRRFWYLTNADNPASVAVIRKAGFALAGCGKKHKRLGIAAIGKYELSRPK